jgi:hypothetical protein
MGLIRVLGRTLMIMVLVSGATSVTYGHRLFLCFTILDLIAATRWLLVLRDHSPTP